LTLVKNLGCPMEYSSMGKVLSSTIAVYLMELNMKPLMLIQVTFLELYFNFAFILFPFAFGCGIVCIGSPVSVFFVAVIALQIKVGFDISSLLLHSELHFTGKTYRIRVHNVGISTSLNFRIQNHKLLLIETEGRYTSQMNFTDFDIHVGQSYSFLVTMDQNATSDYYIVASARFVNETVWQRVTGVGILHYSNSKGPASGPLPVSATDVNHPWSAMNQPRAIKYV